MADIFNEVDEAVRQDRAKAVWKRYGWIAMTVAVVVLGGTAAFTAYQNWQVEAARNETGAILSALLAGEDDPQTSADSLVALAGQVSGGRASLAQLLAANLYGDADAPGAARDTVVALAQGDVADRLDPLVRIQAAFAAVDADDPAVAEALIAPLANHPVWRPQAQEVQALLALRAGDVAAAADLYAGLSNDPAAPAALQSRAALLAESLAP